MLPKPTPKVEHIYTLKTPTYGNLMALTHIHKNKSRTFVVGFADEELAARARLYVHEGGPMALKNYRPVNIQKYLPGHSAVKSMGPLYGDVGALLVVDKTININKGPCLVHPIPLDEFLMYPLSRHLGILVAKAVAQETAEHISFVGEAIESSNNVELFRGQMDYMIR